MPHPEATVPPGAGREPVGIAADLEERGFRRLTTTESKGFRFDIWLKPRIGRQSWHAAVVSCGTSAFATAYVTDGVLRASVPIAEPRGHLLFRADLQNGTPVAGPGFQSKFGAL